MTLMVILIQNLQKDKVMERYNKGITISKEELELIGRNLEFMLESQMSQGLRPDRFEAYKKIVAKIEKSKNKMPNSKVRSFW